jgi:hypothetical protein
LVTKTEADQSIDQRHAEEMRVRHTTLADGRYFLFYEFPQGGQLEIISEIVKGEPTRSRTETKESGV